MLIQQTKEQLHTLKLAGMLDALEQQLAQQQTHELAFEERLALLVERELLYRENRRVVENLVDDRLILDSGDYLGFSSALLAD
jgi:hypothetical protein